MRKRLLAVSIAFLLISAGALCAQSLAEMAKREKERREKIKPESKTITNLDAQKYRSGAVTTLTLPPPPPKPAGETSVTPAASTKADAEPTDLQGRPESFWRQTMADAHKQIKDLENEANVIILRLADLQNRFYRESNGFQQQEIQREIQKSLYEQDRNRENLAKAKEMLTSLEKEARKSGALPGWLTPPRNP